jgi:L-seryl-tRNA(Ser) seleniumtransferase
MDLGSGLLFPLDDYGLGGEPTAADAVRDGASLVVMSGDKLLGGPQAGIIVGTRQAVEACRKNPLTRALRVDKLTLAALEATLSLYRDPATAIREIPVLAMLTASAESIRDRAARMAGHLRNAAVEETEAVIGGGAFPSARLRSFAVALDGDAQQVEERLRTAVEPVIGRIVQGRFLLDLRSVPKDQDDALAAAVMRALA